VFTSRINGQSGKPVLVMQYPGERAVLDNVAGANAIGLSLSGSYTWYIGFEVRNSSSSIFNVSGVAMGGQGQKLINMIVHDNLSSGITSFSSAPDAEVYGCLIYFNGRETQVDGHAYGIYTQNDAGRVKTFRENVIPFTWSYGIHAYTEANRIDNFLFEGNVVYNSGLLWRGTQFERNFFIGSTMVMADANTYLGNHAYYPSSPSGGSRNTFGYQAGTTNLVVTGNWFVGGVFDVSGTSPVITGNTFYRTSGFSGSGNTFLSSPTGTNVFVRPNAYQPGRANIIIYNWSRASSVNVDVSAAGLQSGDDFEVRDALNWFGTPVASGQYAGAPIAIPMTGLTMATPVGTPAVTPTHTAPEFGVFILLPQRTAPAQLPSGALNASPDTIPSSGGTVTLSWSSINATSASIDQGIGLVPLNGSVTAQVTASTTFTLTLNGPGGTTQYSDRVVVRQVGPPPPPPPPPGAPRDYQLEQNYPNPFNPDTKIVFTLPFASVVNLTVHDLLGREVSRLVTGQRAAGTYTIDFSAKGLASGVYFYTIHADNYEEVRKMIIER
jgi:hypothetical protein